MTTHAHLPSRCERITLRGLTCNVRHWGAEGAPRLFMLHGRQDASPTFQFVVDALRQGWHVIAPDWRGHGASGWQHAPYAIADLCADLEAFLLHYSPDVPACIVDEYRAEAERQGFDLTDWINRGMIKSCGWSPGAGVRGTHLLGDDLSVTEILIMGRRWKRWSGKVRPCPM